MKVFLKSPGAEQQILQNADNTMIIMMVNNLGPSDINLTGNDDTKVPISVGSSCYIVTRLGNITVKSNDGPSVLEITFPQ